MESMLPVWPVIILLIGAFICYVCGKLLAHKGWSKYTGVISFLFMIAALLPYYYMAMSPGDMWSLWGNSQVMLKADEIAIFLGIIGISLGALVSLYSVRYMERETGLGKFYGLLNLMVAGIAGIGLSSDLFNMFLFFELMAIPSYVLVAFEKENWEPVEAGMKYVIMSAAGSATALLGISLVFMNTSTLDISLLSSGGAMKSAPALTQAISVILIITGFGVKAAIVPLHTWLPDAHSAAPSGISAMLSGIVIQSGLVAMIKSLTVFNVDLHFGLVLAIFAVLTMTVGNLLALRQTDLKRLLAFSSIAQMGYILLGIGLGFEYGLRDGYIGGILHIINHAFMKGGAFLCAGAVLYAIGTRDLNEMRGVGRRMPIVGISFAIFALSLAGVPPFSGFVSEVFIALAGVEKGGWNLLFTLALVVNAVISLGYYVPAINTVLFSKDVGEKAKGAKEAPAFMLIAIVVMAAMTILLGVYPQIGLQLAEPVARFLGGL